MLPSDLPDWRNVYAYFRIWSEKKENHMSLVEQILKKNWLEIFVPTMVGIRRQAFA